MLKTQKFKFLKAFLLMTLLTMVLGCTNVFAAGGTGVKEPILSQIEPKGVTSVYTGKQLKLRALADSTATVTAKVNGTTVNLTKTSTRTGTMYWFEGSYTVPSVTAGKDLGAISFTAKTASNTETKLSAGLVGVEVPENAGGSSNPGGSSGDNSDISGSVDAVSGQQVSATKKYIDVFKTDDRGEDYAAPYYYNMPKGTIDYVKSVSGNYYELKSGRKVKKSDVAVVADSGSQGNNVISGLNVSVDSKMTTLDIKGKWNVPFNVETSPFTYSSGNWVTSYNATKVTITFDYTTQMNLSGVSIPSGGAFKNATWSTRVKDGVAQGVLELTLSQPNKYYGCYAEYTSTGSLKLRFYNPLNSLSGARIVIDPGHGNNGGNLDSGTIGADGTYESVMNLQKAKALKTELENRGATVYMLDSDGTNLKDLYKRCQLAYDWEPHIYVSVHHNSGAASARGVETYYNTPFSMPLARNINNAIYQAYLQMPYSDGAKNRGYKFSEFAVTRQKQFASVLVEYGFMTNPQEMEILKNSSNVSLFAKHTADGIANYFAGK
ncbi:MAG: hypothetical protein DBY45_09545 [Clostridiales bacterium]|nr:MAG: hypothetical protein DBY45_09545 [Clostridiales bacterium]